MWATVRARVDNSPVACYFNSLMQIYFMLPQFVKKVMDFQYQESEEEKKAAAAAKPAAQKGAAKPEAKYFPLISAT